jgi:hypothetical protein
MCNIFKLDAGNPDRVTSGAETGAAAANEAETEASVEDAGRMSPMNSILKAKCEELRGY